MSATRTARERAVRRTAAFEQLIDLLKPVTQIIERSRDSRLFEQGQTADGLYFILSGTVKVTVNGKGFRSASSSFSKTDDVLCLGSLFSGKPLPTSAVVTSKSVLGFVDGQDFFRFFHDRPDIRLPVLQLLSEEANSCYYDVIRASFRAA